MASQSAGRLSQVVKQHVPLIKFRGGRMPAPQYTAPERVAVAQQTVQVPTQAQSFIVQGTSVRGSGIDHRQLPAKYRQKPLTAEDIEIVEMGGIIP
ncbi:alpha-ketoglutarate dehydrogenase component 4-like isoform X2 [Ptychodera flava]|uniref:alpha-ketoglutarate dehydrogenase component 4-like isoform X2 n=1 Tax=Ptychodera flava TaxID=63121 RepID=UPI00396A8608